MRIMVQSYDDETVARFAKHGLAIRARIQGSPMFARPIYFVYFPAQGVDPLEESMPEWAYDTMWSEYNKLSAW